MIATASSDARLARLTRLGMDEGINYRAEDVAKAVMRLTDQKGVDVAIDPVGGPTLQGSLLSLGYRGRVVSVGAFAGRGRRCRSTFHR